MSQKIATKAKFSTTQYSYDPYVIQPYPDQALLFLATQTDQRFFFSHKIKFWLCPRAGWDQGIAPQLQIERVPGDHFNMLEDPYVQVLGAKLKQYLASVRVKTGS